MSITRWMCFQVPKNPLYSPGKFEKRGDIPTVCNAITMGSEKRVKARYEHIYGGFILSEFNMSNRVTFSRSDQILFKLIRYLLNRSDVVQMLCEHERVYTHYQRKSKYV